MNTECFIKSLMLIVVFLLIISCLQTTEKFSEIDFTKIQIKKSIAINLAMGNEVYYLVSYEQLNNATKEKIIDILLKNEKFMDSRENKNDVKKGIFYKIPVFLASANQIVNLINGGNLNFMLTAETGVYALTPEISGIIAADKYLFFNKDLGFAYYAKEGPNSDIVHINQNGFVKSFGIQKLEELSIINLSSLALITDTTNTTNTEKLNVNIRQN